MRTKEMKHEAPDHMKPYIRNTMEEARDDIASCAKCSKIIKGRTEKAPGQRYYRDVTTGKAAHITCPRKGKASAEAVAA